LIGSEALRPTTIVGGALARDGDRTVLLVGGLSLEVLSEPALPTTPARWAEARKRTRDIFAKLIGQRVLLRTRQIEGTLVSASALQIPGAAPPSSQDAAFATIRDVIARRSPELLGLPGVLAVRPGYRFRNDWITNEPCIVVLVLRKIADADLPDSSRLPERLDGVPVDVAPAGPVEQLLASGKIAALTPEDLANPFGYALPGVQQPAHEAFAAELIRTSKYKPPPDASLDPISGPMNVLCHVSPDAGWPVLKEFLQQTQTNLRVAMYDFTAPHIVRDLESVLAQSGKIELILDPGLSLTAGGRGENPKAGDWTEDDVKADLSSKLSDRFSFVWAAVHRQGKTEAGIFPTAYHIKVASRDANAIWLSSGNWQSSNQPDIDPFGANATLPNLQQIYNREWHVVIENAALASVFERFISWDMEQAAPLNVQPDRVERPDVLVPDQVAEELAKAPTFFKPKSISLGAEEQVQPLLTPDNYAEHVISLIEQATETLRFQNQYIKVSADPAKNPPQFVGLLDALRGRIEAGVDVRIILRDIGNPRAMLEALQAYGIDPVKYVKLQSACHNKGIIVDDRLVCLGSHNWSGDGTCYNRDASLIFDNPEIVAYYTKVFDYDWTDLAHQRTRAESAAPQIARDASPAEPGQARVPWDAYFGDDDRPEIDAILAQAPQPPALIPMHAEAATAVVFGPAIDPRLTAGKRELSRLYLTSEQAVALSAQITGISPTPEVNVLGVGIGEKISDGRPTGAQSIKLFVRLKYPKDEIASDHVLPKTINGVPVDVEEIGDLRPLGAMPNPRLQMTPAQPGCSVGFDESDLVRMAGTFGALVRDASGTLFVLSNNHVLANEGRLRPGAPIFQTGLLDLPPQVAKRQIAELTKFAPYDAPRLIVDAAIAKALTPDLVSREILYIGAPQGVADAKTDMIVHKYGRTTGYSAGRIVSTATDITIDYDTGSFTFHDQILIAGIDGARFSDAGDSGSLILNRATKQAVALLFAGSASHSIANHIGDVLSAFDVVLA